MNTDVSAGDHNSLLYMVWKEEPRFGGMWVDTSEGMEVLHILLTGGEEGATTATVNAHRAVAKIFGRSFDSVAYEKADYTIGELIEWHTALRERVWEIPEVIVLDLDERENGLRIGVRDLAAANDKVPNLVHDLRIPVEAISVYEGESVMIPPLEPVSPDLPPGEYAYAESSNHGTLRQPLPPAVGGTLITLRRSSGSSDSSFGSCTLGFGIRLDSEIGVIINSHCTDEQGRIDGTNLLYTTSRELLAIEAIDPGNTSDEEGIRRCERFSIGLIGLCRYSDAAYARGGESITIAVGFIARPERTFPYTIDRDNPYFEITGLRSVISGEMLGKVGQRTGLTEGRVLRTCADIRVADPNAVVLCNTVTDYDSTFGDSGSPVFTRKGGDSNSVELVGIQLGNNR